MTSLHFLPMFHLLRVSQPIMVIPAKLSSCACAMNSDRILRLFISSPAFEGKNLHEIQQLLTECFICLVHAFQVSKQGHVMPFSVLLSPHHCTHMLVLINLFQFMADGGLDIRKGPCSHKKPTFNIIRYSGESGWSPSGGHLFC